MLYNISRAPHIRAGHHRELGLQGQAHSALDNVAIPIRRSVLSEHVPSGAPCLVGIWDFGYLSRECLLASCCYCSVDFTAVVRGEAQSQGSLQSMRNRKTRRRNGSLLCIYSFNHHEGLQGMLYLIL